MSLRDRISAVLTAHQRHTAQHCLCGWGQLGHSHADHQADAVIAELARSECGGDLCECRQCRVVRILADDDE